MSEDTEYNPVKDLTDPETEKKYIRDELGDKIADFIEKHKELGIHTAMAYCGDEVTLESLREECKPTIHGAGEFQRKYWRRTFIVNPLPTGKWNIITTGELNWPSEGEGCPRVCMVGQVDWNAESKEAKFKGVIITREADRLIESAKETYDCENGEFFSDDIIIYWENKQGADTKNWGDRYEYVSVNLLDAAINKLASEFDDDLLDC